MNTKHKYCSYCNRPFIEKLWCKKCDPYKIIEGWTSGNPDIDKFIKDTMYTRKYGSWLEWIPFDRFTNIKQIGKGGFSKIYSATWIDGKANYKYEYGNWIKSNPKQIKVALKRLNGSHEMSTEYLNELKIHWDVCLEENFCLEFYGLTKDPVTKEFMMIIEFASRGSLRSILLNEFNKILWGGKIRILGHLILGLNNLHKLGYSHKNLHSGNVLICNNGCYGYTNGYISDIGLTGPANKQKPDNKIYGVLPYIAPEILYGKPYTLSSDIYSFGIVMTELSSGKPPFYDRKYDINLALDICNGLKPEFGKGTPEFYKKLAYSCMNPNPRQRPKADELIKILIFWYHSINGQIFGYKGKEVESIFKEADKEIPNISISYGRNSISTHISQIFSFNDLPNAINSSNVSSYFEENMNNKVYCKDTPNNKHEVCPYCNKTITEELWCNECDPHYMIDGWTSEVLDVDKFIKDTMYNVRNYNYCFLEWVPFERFINIKQIGEGGFSKVYSAIWMDGKLGWKPTEVALKKLSGSQNISIEYLNELKIYWNICLNHKAYLLTFYGMTKDPKTRKFMIIMEFANKGNLRNILHNFKNFLWKDKIYWLLNVAIDLENIHGLGYLHKDLHSGNILQKDKSSYISDFGLSGPANEHKLNDKVYGVLPYIAPEVLNNEPYTPSSDIYSFGVIMAELSSGKPPFYDKKHNYNLALDICNGLRPEFGKRTPEIYRKLAYKCMDANLKHRPKADELRKIFSYWNDLMSDYDHSGREIKAIFEEADREIPNISTSYEKDPDAIHSEIR
ncbi:kinase-like protein [Rhizophagus irregularis]|uniref:Kinase-like protein n=2 Tax=Rhizophagus irregularis TaxID=588596 RepID=A0A2N0RRE1_9GLOM|nr:kinase-like protein [Rhizophagus irregularis]